ncbi:Macrolide export ATP-binding/permease protein MacB [Fundidesulfovibrio magnetotacticus]|uniref:Macrolide export ATP-binding/permease protein MacB n=1 Tax=Fundidesulfovibrio magnetotacticus TaxID=2730080 RepID=A0A6V8LRH4_9BACT|nr:ABC transporter permease [Fundidesulfovibrio magnetotacticus]GFK93570.1 Macrolide export ATP-binding/permease protein MacB [Fundidesulfovibrio magnetotacticus]
MLLSLRIALQALATHKLRTALAMLGVFLGALALTGVRHVSLAMMRQAEIEVEKLGPNLFAVMAGQVRFTRDGGARTAGGAATFQFEDSLALMRSLPGVMKGVPVVLRTMPIRAGNTKVACQMVATWPDYPQVRSFQPDRGRFFTWEEEREKAKVVVLGLKIAQRLFGDPEKALGQTVTVYRAGLTVVGVMEEKGSDISGTDQDEQVFVPVSTYMRRMANQTWVTGVFMQMADGTDFARIKREAQSFMRQRHNITGGKRDDFSVLTAEDTMQLKQQALDLVAVLGLISSSLSFAVGGLGILSIMILLVRARRLEIGVRRAMGARRRDIIRQFLLESGVMSMAGGAAGVAAAMGLLTVVYALGNFPYVYDAWLIAQALAGSALLGFVAGAYPAWQAANVEVLHVLRDRQ